MVYTSRIWEAPEMPGKACKPMDERLHLIARLLSLFVAACKRRGPPNRPFGTRGFHLDARTARLNLTTIQAFSTVTLW